MSKEYSQPPNNEQANQPICKTQMPSDFKALITDDFSEREKKLGFPKQRCFLKEKWAIRLATENGFLTSALAMSDNRFEEILFRVDPKNKKTVEGYELNPVWQEAVPHALFVRTDTEGNF